MSFAAIRKDAGLFAGSFQRKGEVFVYVGSIQPIGPEARKGQTTGCGGIGSGLQVLKI